MRSLVAVLSMIASLLAGSSVASADDGRVFSGGGTVPAAQSAADQAKSMVKSNFATRYFAYRKSGGAPGRFPEGLGTLEKALNEGNPFGITPDSYPSGYPSKSLSYTTYQQQINECYCGPASAWMAMASKGLGNSYLGESLTQSNLGASSWLNTSGPPTCNGTGRGSNWTHTLNGWADGTDAGWYLITNFSSSADAADVATKFIMDIDYNYAPVMNVWMNSDRGYLPGWSDYTDVHHYVPGYGYTGYGDYFNYVEVFGPVTAGYKTGVTKELFAAVLGSMGMIW